MAWRLGARSPPTVYVFPRAIDSLKTVPAPFLPFTCQQLHEFQGYEGSIIDTLDTTTLQEDTRAHLALRYDASELTGIWRRATCSPGRPCADRCPSQEAG